ncbi:hypothetical protein CDAR_605211 [Caerostris darwini]|uniref:Uncharacterized protein n=1 Tax=Caerostris darwini TaxID=1538125 RepID=A0AAV4U8Q0_9ARAC|nr:hypothetical protein CDAR_605211 [Caerostris darwini]
MEDTRRVHPIQIYDLEQGVLNAVDRNPSTSVCVLTAAIIAPSSTLWRVQHKEGLHAFHLQRDQVFQVKDYPRRVAFARKSESVWHFPCFVLFTDEVSFTREGVVKTIHAEQTSDVTTLCC